MPVGKNALQKDLRSMTSFSRSAPSSPMPRKTEQVCKPALAVSQLRHGGQRQSPDRVGFHAVLPAVAIGALPVAHRGIRPASEIGDNGPTASAGELVGAGAVRASRPSSWAKTSALVAAAFLRRAGSLLQAWAARRRDRRELLDYIAQDHRAAADMKKTQQELESWARKPFWIP